MRQTRTSQLPCGFSEDLLIAEALGEVSTYESNQHVLTHLGQCDSCQTLFERYRLLRQYLHAMTSAQEESQGLATARQQLDASLLDKNRPRLQLDVWHSPVGDIRIGKTQRGVALVEFVRPEETAPFHYERFAVEPGGPEVTALIHKLEDFFSGKTRDLAWIVDDVLMRSDFQREVLRATADVPYGTVVTYQGIADAIGQPKAVRAVAQALRHNPVPIHIPCHRVIGSDGALTGYAGNLVGIKKAILEIEGIPVVETTKGLIISKTRMYVGWRHDHWFCRPDCASLKDQPAGDRTLIASRMRAEEMGYQACDLCRPDVYPLSLL